MANQTVTWQSCLHARYENWYRVTYPSGYKDGLMAPMKAHSDTSTKGLTDAIKAWVKYSGGKTDNNSGLSSFRIEKIERRGGIEKRPQFNKMPKGRNDLGATHAYNSIAIEVKCKATGDSSSIEQYEYYLDVTTPDKITGKPKGLYIIAEAMQGFVDWWMVYEESLSAGTFPLKVDGMQLQPVYDKPKEKKIKDGPLFGNEVDNLPTLAEWRAGSNEEAGKGARMKDTVKAGRPKETKETKILSARFGHPPPYIKDGENSCPMDILDKAFKYFAKIFPDRTIQTSNGPVLKRGVMLKPCIYYTMKPPVKIQKRVPKGLKLQNGILVDEQGFTALNWLILPDGTYQNLTNVDDIQEKFNIPDFIVSNEKEVYIVDNKKDTNDGKIFHYIVLVKFILQAKGDNRRVWGGVIGGVQSDTKWRVFNILNIQQ